MNNQELTYEEHIEGKKTTYRNEIAEILRNTELNQGDIDSEEILTNNFFKRTDISDSKKDILKNKTDSIEKTLKV